MFCLPGGALRAPASMRTATVHPAKMRGKCFIKPAIVGKASTGCSPKQQAPCSSDSWLQRGNICLKTCTPFTAGFMPELAGLCVKILAMGALLEGYGALRVDGWKKIYEYLYDGVGSNVLAARIVSPVLKNYPCQRPALSLPDGPAAGRARSEQKKLLAGRWGANAVAQTPIAAAVAWAVQNLPSVAVIWRAIKKSRTANGSAFHESLLL